MSLLYALTGCFDAPGGNVLFPAVRRLRRSPARICLRPGAWRRPLGLDRTPARAGARGPCHGARSLSGHPGRRRPIRCAALIGFGANLLLAHADGATRPRGAGGARLLRPCRSVHDPDRRAGRHCPAGRVGFEREALKIGFEISAEAQSLVQLRPAVVPPPGEARPDTDFIFDLAGRLGLGEQFWNGDIDAAYRHQLAPSGVTLEQLRADAARRARAAADPLRQVCRAGREGRRRAALPRRRARSSSTRRPCSTTAIRRCRISWSRRWARWRGPIWRRASRWS